MDAITSRDRHDLLEILRSRERVARAEVAQRAAEVRADFEKQLAAIYSFDDDAIWADAAKAAKAAEQEANASIAARCAKLGIPAEFAPSVFSGWSSRGQNAIRERRVELRALAVIRIDALARAATAAIARESVAAKEAVITGGLSSAAAHVLLATLPTVASLMPPLAMESVVGDMQARRLSKRGGA